MPTALSGCTAGRAQRRGSALALGPGPGAASFSAGEADRTGGFQPAYPRFHTRGRSQ